MRLVRGSRRLPRQPRLRIALASSSREATTALTRKVARNEAKSPRIDEGFLRTRSRLPPGRWRRAPSPGSSSLSPTVLASALPPAAPNPAHRSASNCQVRSSILPFQTGPAVPSFQATRVSPGAADPGLGRGRGGRSPRRWRSREHPVAAGALERADLQVRLLVGRGDAGVAEQMAHWRRQVAQGMAWLAALPDATSRAVGTAWTIVEAGKRHSALSSSPARALDEHHALVPAARPP
jgi:hypothetical protein